MTSRLLYFLPLLLLAAVVAAAVPAAMDPLKLSPHIYTLQLENERVRVIEETIRNGEWQPAHAFSDRVMVFLQTCAWLEKDANGAEQMVSYKHGEAVWAAAEISSGSKPVVQECKVLHIELR